jgi:hypothetical protein
LEVMTIGIKMAFYQLPPHCQSKSRWRVPAL